jgi:hypothetical protein
MSATKALLTRTEAVARVIYNVNDTAVHPLISTGRPAVSGFIFSATPSFA